MLNFPHLNPSPSPDELEAVLFSMRCGSPAHPPGANRFIFHPDVAKGFGHDGLFPGIESTGKSLASLVEDLFLTQVITRPTGPFSFDIAPVGNYVWFAVVERGKDLLFLPGWLDASELVPNNEALTMKGLGEIARKVVRVGNRGIRQLSTPRKCRARRTRRRFKPRSSP